MLTQNPERTRKGKAGLGLWRRRKEAGLPLLRRIPQNSKTGHTSESQDLLLTMAKSGWIGRLQEQRKLLLMVSVYTSLQQFVAHKELSEPHVVSEYLAILSWLCFHELVQTPSGFYLYLRKTLLAKM